MFGLSKYLVGGAALALALALAWGFRVDALRANWRTEALGWRKSTSEVTAQIGNAIGNPKLKWENVPEQVEVYAKGHDALLLVTEAANAQIDAMGAESEQLRKLNAGLRAKAEKLIRERERLFDRLERSADDPGDRADCQAQLQAVEAALDAVVKEGGV